MRVSRRAVATPALLVSIAANAFVSARADTRDYVKIADPKTAIPGGAGNFATFSQPQVSQGNIVFGGFGANGQRGLYRFDPSTGTLSTIVDANTGFSGSVSTTYKVSASTGSFSILGSDVTFMTSLSLPWAQILTTRGGAGGFRTVLNDLYQPVGPISMGDTLIAYGRPLPTPAVGAGFSWVTYDGTALGGYTFMPVHIFQARGDGTVKYASNNKYVGTRGNYFISGAQTFADGGGPLVATPNFLPGETSGYTLTGGGPLFDYDGSSTIFRAAASPDGSVITRLGLFVTSPTGRRTVVDSNSVIPSYDDVTTFGSFTSVAIDQGRIAFIGGPSTGPAGIYATNGGPVFELLSVGDTLAGKTVQSLSFSGERPLSGDDLVFTATFTDGSTGLYLAQVPEPAGTCLMVLGAVTLLGRRRAGGIGSPRDGMRAVAGALKRV